MTLTIYSISLYLEAGNRFKNLHNPIKNRNMRVKNNPQIFRKKILSMQNYIPAKDFIIFQFSRIAEINSLAATSSDEPLPSALIKADPMIAPLAYLQDLVKVSLSLMPKPTSIGFFRL